MASSFADFWKTDPHGGSQSSSRLPLVGVFQLDRAAISRGESVAAPVSLLALTLFVTGIGANDENFASSSNNFTVFTNSLHARADFHRSLLTRFHTWLKPTSIGMLGATSQGPIEAIFSVIFPKKSVTKARSN